MYIVERTIINSSEPNIATIQKDDSVWFLDGLRHREDGPAIQTSDGVTAWYLHGNLHREDGPAFEFISSNNVWCKAWYLNGLLHRENGPAIEASNGSNYWFLNGTKSRPVTK